jgi:diguanylate cyclase (GGDEF)-like protein/PAS domain S-box-containing protein
LIQIKHLEPAENFPNKNTCDDTIGTCLMLRVYACLTEQHDLRLVVLAGLICLFATYTAFSLMARAGAHPTRRRNKRDRTQFAWILGAGFAAGSGIWATHFIAMLAFEPNLPVGYALGPTLLSIVIAAGVAGLGFAVTHFGSQRRERATILMGGAILGAGISAMHYVGMSAVTLAGVLLYDPGMVAASVAIGIGLGAAATYFGFGRQNNAVLDLKARLTAASVLTLAICGMHFTAMAAASVLPDPGIAFVESTLSSNALAIAVTAVALLILALSLTGAIIDQHLATRSALEAQRLRGSEARFRQLADATFEGVVIHKDGVVLDVNVAMAALIGWPQDALIGRSVFDLVTPKSHAALRARLESIRLGAGTETGDQALELGLQHADGSEIPIEILARTMPLDSGNARVVAVRDIRERKAAEERIRYMAHHDGLTGLPNRTLFQDRLGQALARAKRSGTTVSVLCLDLDRFKTVNDLNGHGAGDELLRQVAQRLSECIRADDTVARLGGDEFAIIQVGVSHPDGPAVLAERLVAEMARPFDLGGQQTVVGTSIGVSLFPSDGMTGDDLVRAADTALYRAKESGRSTFRFFEAQMDLRLQERRHLERDLRQAIANEQLKVHYQPLADCGEMRILGFEALVRWSHPERGNVSPADFIPLAEESGLIMPLGNWVLRNACREAMTWPDDKIIAVNLSPVQFRHADLAKTVLGILAETGLAPHRLELEITEGVLIEDAERTLATLNTLKAAGIHISLDDFGTGYSSLSYLQRFPFDKIKIDRSFIWEMEENDGSMAIVRAVIALGRSLHLTVTAEGVETPRQLDLLRSQDCDQAQGYLLGRPMSREDVAKLLLSDDPLAALGTKSDLAAAE